MPIESHEVGSPPATIRFESPKGPVVVGDPDADPTKSTGLHEHNPGDETVEAGWHGQESTGLHEHNPGEETVALEGWDQPGAAKKAPVKATATKATPTKKAPAKAASKSVDKGSVQTKVVTPPSGGKGSGTSGAKGK